MILATGPDNFNRHIVIGIAGAALKMGVKVKIFLMDEGVYNLVDSQFMTLLELGAEISVCSLNAEEKNIRDIKGVKFGSQFDHAEIVKTCDRYLGFFR